MPILRDPQTIDSYVAESSTLHVAPVQLRTLSQGGLHVRFAILDSMAFVIGQTGAGGSVGTSLERPCTDAHWGFVIDGKLTFIRGRRRETVPSGRAFHVPPGGASHRFETAGRAVVAGFAPVDPAMDLSDGRFAAQGFTVVERRSGSIVVPPITPLEVSSGAVECEPWQMSGYVMTRVRMGDRSGYRSGWCDAPHWGLVISGSMTIEWEQDVEVVAAGDVFHCPAGPPGHRLEAADPATFIDLTPLAAFDGGVRLADWRRGAAEAPAAVEHGIAVTALG
jgi:quercetin dioxygenase-like cupin family protein